MIAGRDDGVGKFIGIQLLLLSFASGCMDILSYTRLGQVFTSAMTGNAALLGLDIGQGNLAATSRNLAAFAGFLGGLAVGAALLRGRQQALGWSRAITWTLVLEEVLLVGFAALWQIGDGPSSGRLLYGLIVLSGIAMGMQSTVAHSVGVPGITTTYFTGTLTGIVIGLIGKPAPPRTPQEQTPRRRHRLGWPAFAFLIYVAGAALTGLLEARPPPWLAAAPVFVVPVFVVPALPAMTLVVVLLMAALSAVIGARRRGQAAP
ncbi:MAG TPA: YoaK family protein [Acetobacteraceae bacterium]|nr:YoaK family protein [Acetobacteraceae bacterium]